MLRDLPVPVARALAAAVKAPVAEPGERWEATDVRTRTDLPHRRFVVAGYSKLRAFVVYEHGGIGKHQHLVAFSNAPASSPRVVANVYVGEASNVEEIRSSFAKPLLVANHF